jgi:transcriptional regulator with XRE-family HTH domain
MPESIGKILKRIRESKRFSIEEVSERSRIPKNIVFIIEEDRLSEINSGFYAKSFIKTYAAFLGALDESGIKEYLAMGRKKQETVSMPIAAPPQIDFSAIAKYKKQALAIVIGIFVFWVLSLAIGRVVKFIKSAPAKKQMKSAVVKAVVKKGTPKNKKAEKSDSIELEVSALGNTWLQVTIDGDIVFTGSFKKGSNDTWKAKKEIKLEAGNSGVVKININGKPAGFSGKKGEKKEITITKDGIK